MSFPLVGNPSSERLRTSRSDKSRYHTDVLLSIHKKGEIVLIEIYKKLPGTNCGKCGESTCMAFAIKVKKSQANLSDCPFVTAENLPLPASAPDSSRSYEQVSKLLEEEAVSLDFREAAERTGGAYIPDGGKEAIRIRMTDQIYELRKAGLFENGSYCKDVWAKIIIYDYVRRKGGSPLTGERVTLGHFPRTATHVKTFQDNAEKKIAERFKNSLDELKKSCVERGGEETEGNVKTDYSCRFELLPRVPLYLSFWMADEEFDAECKLLFDSSAEDYIDIEYLANLLERFAGDLARE
jgi:hypothetical protein